MPPKRGTKRKGTNGSTTSGDLATSSNGTNAPLTAPDRATWPGWVEMESEPAFFNVMLKDMGVKGVKVQEVYDMDESVLATLPQPVHAMIFLFRYRETEAQQKEKSCPKDIWFANQTPDFACATFAMLNIVNNIPGLELGDELRKFRDFTRDMDPLSRGDAVDSFEFVKRIHNSFARENDLLQADMHLRAKANKMKKRQALQKSRETRAAKKAEKEAASKTPLKEKSINTAAPTRTSDRKKPRSRKSPKETVLEDDPDGDFETPAKGKHKSESPAADDGDGDFKAASASKAANAEQTNGLRRSKREPKPRKDKPAVTEPEEPAADEGFHFAAYMPINGHVWELDGLDSFPHDLGTFSEGEGGHWINVAQPIIMGRMMQYTASEIQFNLMAIVHDPLSSDKQALLDNIKVIQIADKKLDGIYDDWRAMEGAETTKATIVDVSAEFGITAPEVQDAEVSASTLAKLEDDDLLKLIEVRKDAVRQQAGLRAAVRDAATASVDDEEKARHRRHDYGTFVKSWLGALASQEVLSELIEA